MRQELTIPDYLPPTINRLMFGPVRRRIRLCKECREFVWTYGVMQGVTPAKGKRRVTIRLTLGTRRRPRDADSSFKAILDALVWAQLLRDDSPDWCELMPLQQERGHRNATVVVLEDVTAIADTSGAVP